MWKQNTVYKRRVFHFGDVAMTCNQQIMLSKTNPFETGEFTYRFIASDSLVITVDVKNQLMKEGQGFNGDKKMGVEETKKTLDAQEYYYQAVEAASIRLGGGKGYRQTTN